MILRFGGLSADLTFGVGVAKFSRNCRVDPWTPRAGEEEMRRFSGSREPHSGEEATRSLGPEFSDFSGCCKGRGEAWRDQLRYTLKEDNRLLKRAEIK